MQDFFSGTFDLKEINQTLIVPIPKCNFAQMVSDFRPIGLYKEIYKIMFKIMVQCLNQVLQKCISDEKVAHLEVKQIVNNVILSSECFKKISVTRGKSKWCVLKCLICPRQIEFNGVI